MAVRVNIREFKARLSEYLRRVQAGEVVEITKRGQLIGQVIPVEATPEARMQALARLGLVQPARGGLPPMKPPARVQGRKTVAELLVEDRG